MNCEDEWNTVSMIAKPEAYGDGDKYHYTPLYKWANSAMKKKGDDPEKTGFYYLEEHEMTFNKERNPPPAATQHLISFEQHEIIKQLLQN